MDDVDRPNPRNDKRYPFIKGGYELFDDGRFFYYMSAAFKMANDEQLLNTAYRMAADGTWLQTMPPGFVFGSETMGTSVVTPGSITTIDNTTNPNARVDFLKTNNNLGATHQLIEKIESSIGESSIDTSRLGGVHMTAYESNLLQTQAKTLLGLFAQMVSFMVEDYGRLRIGDILQHMTVGEVGEVEGGSNMLKFRSFLLQNKTVEGKNKTRKIKFDMNLPQGNIAQSGILDQSRKIRNEELKFSDSTQLYLVNPAAFRKLKYKCVMSSESVNPKSDALMKAMNLEEYDRAIQNPLIITNPKNLEAVTRDLLFGSYDRTKDDSDSYLDMTPPGQPSATPGQPQSPNQDAAAVALASQSSKQPPTPMRPWYETRIPSCWPSTCFNSSNRPYASIIIQNPVSMANRYQNWFRADGTIGLNSLPYTWSNAMRLDLLKTVSSPIPASLEESHERCERWLKLK